MKTKTFTSLSIIVLFFLSFTVQSQDYFFKEYQPFNKEIPSPEEFLGYPIGEYHTRHDLVVAYMEELAKLSDRATLKVYGKTNENRRLVMLTITSSKNHQNISNLLEKHSQVVDENTDVSDYSDLPIFINLGYNVHGNEPSGTESALLTAYTLVASENPKVTEYLSEVIIFLDPTINPDGRDRHTNWVNSFRGSPFIADKYDVEHNANWPWGRTNHYWFDLNRDLLLAVQPESIARLKWFHKWHPNVVTDFHEMSTTSTFFFEPKQLSASLIPVTPRENYTTLNDAFAKQFKADLDKVGSLYFTKEKYDATYPGYGSTYADLKGSLALLFEQAGSRGHVQETPTGEMTFAFTIRNQYISSFATIKASIINKNLLYSYQNKFYKNAIKSASENKIKGYVFGDNYDKNRVKEFIDLLIKHEIKVYPLNDDVTINKTKYKKEHSFVIPTKQKEYLMVRTMFETNKKFRDSVFYDASSWSVVNFYNLKYNSLTKTPILKNEITSETNKIQTSPFQKSSYGYLISWDDYYTPSLLYKLQENNLVVKTALKPFTITANSEETSFERGTLFIANSLQNLDEDALFSLLKSESKQHQIQVYSVNSGFSIHGIDLGSSNFKTLKQPKVMMLIEGSVSAYEAGEVWHLFEQRMEMPIVKVPEDSFGRVELDRYNVIIMVSGRYRLLDDNCKDNLKEWVSKGNTLITTRTGSSWAINKEIVKEVLIEKVKDTLNLRLDYADSRGTIGKERIGGAIFNVDLDITHPIAFGFKERTLPVYKNNAVFLAPTKNRFSTVAKYTETPLVDGFVSQKNVDNYITKSAAIIVSGIGKGRVILFADNPNFRGAWYGTNKLFMNSIFFGSLINVPN